MTDRKIQPETVGAWILLAIYAVFLWVLIRDGRTEIRIHQMSLREHSCLVAHVYTAPDSSRTLTLVCPEGVIE